MQKNILSTIFLDVYNNFQILDNKKSKIFFTDYSILEQVLEDYLVDILGYKIKYNYEQNFREIRKYFENIIYNTRLDGGKSIIQSIENYKKIYIEKIQSHQYVNLFVETMKRMYSKSYDGKLFSQNKNSLNETIITISNKGNSFVIGRIPRKNEEQLPLVYINDIDKFEIILKKYIEAVVISDSFYNLFKNNNFMCFSFEDKIKALIESTMFNATNNDLNYIENFFIKYTDFIKDKTFDNIRIPSYVGNLFEDELYVMSKRSELEYETPYYLAFMLKNKKVELPNVRMGIELQDDKRIAHIIALQTAQKVLDIENFDIIQKEIKKNLPKDSNFRFYNPTHLVSILLTFGILNGMEIKEINVKDYLPFRYNKTILDRQMNPTEADNFQNRLTNKNLITYMRLIELIEGVNIMSYPEMDMGLRLKLEDKIKCKNEFLQKIYDIGYEFGKNNKTNIKTGLQK